MPSVSLKLHSIFFKLLLKHRLQSLAHASLADTNPFGITSRPEDDVIVAANPTFTDGVASKDLHIDPLSSLSLRIFLPDTSLSATDLPSHKIRARTSANSSEYYSPYGSPRALDSEEHTRHRGAVDAESLNQDNGVYRGYLPAPPMKNIRRLYRKLPVILQFHGGGFISGSNDSVANDIFCRRIAKLCDAIVIAVGYRLAPENKYPAAFEDGLTVLNWLGKQANLAECSKSLGNVRNGGREVRRSDVKRNMIDGFGATMVEPWLAAHGDPSRCVLLGVSCGANIADYVARRAVEAGNLLYPIKVVAQVLMYPFFIGSIPTHSEIKLSNAYFYDKALCTLAWKLFLPEEEFNLDHPAANPLIPGREPDVKFMPPTLTVVAEHDFMRDRAIAYSEALRKVNVDAPVLDYKDAVHDFATIDMLLKTPQAQACAEDIAIWVKKYISLRGHEFSY